jgi:hypothetical protein
MADVTVTPAEVLPATDTLTIDGTAGATVTAGQTCYLDSSDNKYKLADADASAATAAVKGLAMHGASDGQPIRLAIGGTIDPGFTAAVGTIYVQSGTAGGIAPVTDLATGDFTTIIGVGISASSLKLLMINSGVQVPA